MLFVKLLCLFFISLTIILLYVVNKEQPEPYMDEIFHYPQAQKFYNGVYTEWDAKITTPPGLYLATVTPLVPLSKLIGVDLCRLEFFRMTNLFFTIGNFYLIYKILHSFHNEGQQKQVLSALTISTFPVLYFFSFLYYTDCGSTFFVLLMLIMHQKNLLFAATLSGATAIVFRQTNIVWIFYVAAEKSLSIILHLYEDFKAKEAKLKKAQQSTANSFVSFFTLHWKRIFFEVFYANCNYIVIALACFIFVFFNGSIALGDKAAHQVCLNIPQLLYFLLFTLFFASPHLITFTKFKKFHQFIMKNKFLVFIFSLACSLCITYMTHVHPYLLADNRHFTFYVWKRLLGRNLYLQHALIPLYLYSSWAIFSELNHTTLTTQILLTLCISISTVPQKLLEFRYFIIPYIMIRTRMRAQSKWQLYCEFFLFTFINCAVLHLFLNRAFKWENSEEKQRFMW